MTQPTPQSPDSKPLNILPEFNSPLTPTCLLTCTNCARSLPPSSLLDRINPTLPSQLDSPLLTPAPHHSLPRWPRDSGHPPSSSPPCSTGVPPIFYLNFVLSPTTHTLFRLDPVCIFAQGSTPHTPHLQPVFCNPDISSGFCSLSNSM